MYYNLQTSDWGEGFINVLMFYIVNMFCSNRRNLYMQCSKSNKSCISTQYCLGVPLTGSAI